MRPIRRLSRACLAVALALAAAATGAAADRLIEGELLRVDLGKRLVVVRPSSGDPREVDVKVEEATTISAAGRTLRLDELKTGERVVVACEGQGAEPCHARRVRSGPLRHGVPPAVAR
jgi:hypothetical protein